jgi:hypothetical protein
MSKVKSLRKFIYNYQNLVSFNDITLRLGFKNVYDDMTSREFNKIIQNLCKEHQITIDKKRFKSPVGRAWIEEKIIKIPQIKNMGIIEFMVALHEIGHVVMGSIEPKCVEEYSAEIWAIKTAKKLKVDPSPYYKMSMAYVLRNIAECHNKCRIEIDKLPNEIKKYVKLIEPNLSSWKGFIVDVCDSQERVIIKKSKIVYYDNI